MRAIEKKRPPLMTKRRWTILILLLLVAIITLIALFYRSIQSEVWQQERDIKKIIEQRAAYDLESIESLEKYVWESAYWILLANKVENGALTYSVWDNTNFIAELNYNVAITKEDMQNIVTKSKSNATNISLQAGYAFNQFVWEVKYRDRDTSHMKIAFYNMTTGALIDEYTIPKGSMPISDS